MNRRGKLIPCWFVIQLRFEESPEDSGDVKILRTIYLSDPEGFFSFALQRAQGGRQLTGADLDPESFVRLADGTIWLGDEFGPWLMHFNSEGKLLAPPVGLPVPEDLLATCKGVTVMRSPGHPDFLGSELHVPAVPEELPTIPNLFCWSCSKS